MLLNFGSRNQIKPCLYWACAKGIMWYNCSPVVPPCAYFFFLCYLLCHMFEEAADLAISILTRVVENQGLCKGSHDVLLQDMMESTAMVLVQSSKELGRTGELLNQLKYYFGSTAAIPVEVVLIGACVQVSSGFSSSVQEFLEDFLSNWQFENGKYVAVADSNLHVTYAGGAGLNLALEVDQYLKVVEFYVVTLLGMALNNPDRATLWIEKAHMPEEARQDLIRRLESLCSLKTTSMATKSSLVEEQEIGSFHGKEIDETEKSLIKQNGSYPDRTHKTKQSSVKWPGRLEQFFCRFRNMVYNHRNTCTDASKMKMLLGCLIFILCYRLHKKRHVIIRYAKNHLLSLKQGLVDLWQLAFSYQVNPLAAVQSLPVPNQRS